MINSLRKDYWLLVFFNSEIIFAGNKKYQEADSGALAW
jgi:hypothetical protein